MASKYAKTVKVPSEFPDMLRNFAREVLRNQEQIQTRDDIHRFGIQYFKNMMERDAGASTDPAHDKEKYLTMSDEEIEDYLWQMFRASDPGNVGQLYALDFKQVFEAIADELNLNSNERKRCASEADETENGFVQYSDFISATIRAISTFRTKKMGQNASAVVFPSPPVPSPLLLVHGLLREEFESVLLDILHHRHHQDQDPNHTHAGVVRRADLIMALQNQDLALTRREINLVLFNLHEKMTSSRADNDQDDGQLTMISTATDIPLVFDILVDAHANSEAILGSPTTEEAIAQILARVFSSGDDNGTGVLSLSRLKSLLQTANLGLTRRQIIALVSCAVEEEDDAVAYDGFINLISKRLWIMLDYATQVEMSSYVTTYRESEEYFMVQGLHQHEIESALSTAFESIDERQRGVLTRQEIIEAVQNAFPNIPSHLLLAMLALTESDENGDLDYSVIVQNAFQALQSIQEFESFVSTMF